MPSHFLGECPQAIVGGLLARRHHAVAEPSQRRARRKKEQGHLPPGRRSSQGSGRPSEPKGQSCSSSDPRATPRSPMKARSARGAVGPARLRGNDAPAGRPPRGDTPHARHARYAPAPRSTLETPSHKARRPRKGRPRAPPPRRRGSMGHGCPGEGAWRSSEGARGPAQSSTRGHRGHGDAGPRTRREKADAPSSPAPPRLPGRSTHAPPTGLPPGVAARRGFPPPQKAERGAPLTFPGRGRDATKAQRSPLPPVRPRAGRIYSQRRRATGQKRTGQDAGDVALWPPVESVNSSCTVSVTASMRPAAGGGQP